MASNKTFKIPGDQIRDVARGHGACVATDKITVEGAPVGFMYREEADGDLDSGWRFLAGTESDEYMDEADNHGVYDVNTIANYDRDIVAFLTSPVGSAFERSDDGTFRQVDAPSASPGEEDGEASDEDVLVVEGVYRMTREWSISLPGPFKRRFDDEDLVLFRPGVTAWIVVWDKPASESKSDRLALLRSDISPEAYDHREEVAGGLLRLSYRLREEGSEARSPGFYSYTVGEGGHVQMAVYFDAEEDVEVALGLWRSLTESAA